mgnify:CR=1 FL=1
MKFALFFAAAVLTAHAADLTGIWKAEFREDVQFKTFSHIKLDLKAEGSRLTGMAHIGSWPGDAPISNGKIEGDRISFTVVGDSPWWSSSAAGDSRSAYPRFDFTGVVRGDKIEIKVVFGNVMIYGKEPPEHDYEMIAARMGK